MFTDSTVSQLLFETNPHLFHEAAFRCLPGTSSKVLTAQLPAAAVTGPLFKRIPTCAVRHAELSNQRRQVSADLGLIRIEVHGASIAPHRSPGTRAPGTTYALGTRAVGRKPAN
jgi:hypothetical protein